MIVLLDEVSIDPTDQVATIMQKSLKEAEVIWWIMDNELELLSTLQELNEILKEENMSEISYITEGLK